MRRSGTALVDFVILHRPLMSTTLHSHQIPTLVQDASCRMLPRAHLPYLSLRHHRFRTRDSLEAHTVSAAPAVAADHKKLTIALVLREVSLQPHHQLWTATLKERPHSRPLKKIFLDYLVCLT